MFPSYGLKSRNYYSYCSNCYICLSVHEGLSISISFYVSMKKAWRKQLKTICCCEESAKDWQGQFLRVSNQSLSVTSPGWRKQKTSCARHLIHHKKQERNMKWQGHLMSTEEELKRQAQYGSADGDLRVCGPDSVCMQSPTPLWIICVCAGCVSKEMMSMLPELSWRRGGLHPLVSNFVVAFSEILFAVKWLNMLHLS